MGAGGVLLAATGVVGLRVGPGQVRRGHGPRVATTGPPRCGLPQFPQPSSQVIDRQAQTMSQAVERLGQLQIHARFAESRVSG